MVCKESRAVLEKGFPPAMTPDGRAHHMHRERTVFHFGGLTMRCLLRKLLVLMGRGRADGGI
jgi:hypothetical protein